MEQNNILYKNVIDNPTRYNKLLFIHGHFNYICQTIYNIRPWIKKEDISDIAYDVTLKLYSIIDIINWNLNYEKIKGFMSKTTQYHLRSLYRKNKALKTIPQMALVQIQDWQDELTSDIANDYLQIQLDIIQDLLKKANKTEKRVIEGLLDGKNYKDLKMTRQGVNVCLKRFGKKIKIRR